MKRNRRRLPVPQPEFGFTPDAFNLMVESGIDGDRIARERGKAKPVRRKAGMAQAALFQSNPANHE
jgi:hypothetical protein